MSGDAIDGVHSLVHAAINGVACWRVFAAGGHGGALFSAGVVGFCMAFAFVNFHRAWRHRERAAA